jgi:hypothetical protein
MFRHFSDFDPNHSLYRKLYRDATLARRAQKVLQPLFDRLSVPKTVVVVSKQGDIVLWAENSADAFLLRQNQQSVQDTLQKAGIGDTGLRIKTEPSLQNDGCKRG